MNTATMTRTLAGGRWSLCPAPDRHHYNYNNDGDGGHLGWLSKLVSCVTSSVVVVVANSMETDIKNVPSV